MHGGGCVCRSVWLHTGVCLRTYSRLFCLCSFSLRLPEPRANPMDPRDFEDNDFEPSMDHAPWYQQIRLFTHPLVLQRLLQPAVNCVPCTPPRHSCCLLAVNWPWRRLLRQIWLATSFLLQKCLNYSLLTDFLHLGKASYMQSITIRLHFLQILGLLVSLANLERGMTVQPIGAPVQPNRFQDWGHFVAWCASYFISLLYHFGCVMLTKTLWNIDKGTFVRCHNALNQSREYFTYFVCKKERL